MDVETIKKKFLALRKKQGLKWADLAAAAGVNDYHKIINLLNSPGLTLATLEKLSKLVNVQPWQLLKPDDDSQGHDSPAGPVVICPRCGAPLQLSIQTSPDAGRLSSSDGTGARQLATAGASQDQGRNQDQSAQDPDNLSSQDQQQGDKSSAEQMKLF